MFPKFFYLNGDDNTFASTSGSAGFTAVFKASTFESSEVTLASAAAKSAGRSNVAWFASVAAAPHNVT